MPMVTFAARKQPKLGNDVKALIHKFIEKLSQTDETSGLHIEPIHHSADSRARTGRVNDSWRAVLFRIDPAGGDTHYIYVGTWPHDEAIAMAKKLTLSVNPVNGVLELHEAIADSVPEAGPSSEHQTSMPQTQAVQPLLPRLGYLQSDLVDEFGFGAELAQRAFQIADEDAMLLFADALETPWQQEVLVSMAAGEALHTIKERLSLQAAADADDAAEPSDEDSKIVKALEHPASKMQFTYVGDSEELRRIIEDGDFGKWRIFLHPEQRAYVERDYRGAFRLSGGAGTGKTVVLLHRARRLSRENPEARVVLTTFTRALAENLRRDMMRLDPSVRIAGSLGEAGVLIRGVDQLAAEVRALAGAGFSSAAARVIGSARETSASVGAIDWKIALAQTGFGLPAGVGAPGFLDDEYTQVILPAAITEAAEYFRVRRPGRGVALDRGKRAKVWDVVEQMRKDQRAANTIGFGEIAAVGAAWLASTRTFFADHVLVDEGQDLGPAKWQLLRALVPEGPNDMFVGDDAHQRIYGRATVLKRYGIKIQGRSRRLTLNYRTTAENLRYAIRVLEGETFEDLESDSASVEGYRSARSGPAPVLRSAASVEEQYDLVATDMQQWLSEGVRPETIAVLAATRKDVTKLQEQLSARGVPVTALKDAALTSGRPVVLTMHTAKGMEFSRVVLFDISAGVFPPAWAYRDVADEDRADVDRNFRALLYVAASRARDELVVSWAGERSGVLG